MKRIAHITNNQITNVSVAGDDYVLPADGSRMLEADALAAGMTHAPRLPPAPDAITPRQLRLWLMKQGVTSALVETAISGMPSPTKEAALIEWEYALEFRRDHPLVQQLGAVLGFDAATMETGWREAAAA
jgi:hypothetical protein